MNRMLCGLGSELYMQRLLFKVVPLRRNVARESQALESGPK
jgi:hypothetical protein